MRDISEYCVSPLVSLRDVLVCINTTSSGIALVVDEDRRLVGVITDGDVRRAILNGIDLNASAQLVLDRKDSSHRPVTAPLSMSHNELMALLHKTGVSQIPLLNVDGQVAGLVRLDDLLDDDEIALHAVVMAGGLGTRLHPLTEDLPKPMLPVGDRPLMEHILRQLSEAGIRQVNVTTHYLAKKITDYFGDGQLFGVELKYIPEERLLGTAGGLGLMPPSDEPLLVINGDILTRVDFRAMLKFHKEHQAALTMAVRQYEVQIPYGVIETEGPLVRRLVEKPTPKFFVNAGIYLLEPATQRLIPSGEHFDMTDLIRLLLNQGQAVVGFPIWEYWRDIGQHKDYQEAQADAKNGKII